MAPPLATRTNGADPGAEDLRGSFPTGATVPFPYEKPYPQQTDLMDAILRSLSVAARACATNDDAPSPSSPGRRRCPVLMLESPTGTGKSLSLACASVAWLRHVERRDAPQPNGGATTKGAASAEEDPSANEAGASTTAPTASSSTGIDWLDSWVPPEKREDDYLRGRVRNTASRARRALTDQLHDIRTKLGHNDGDDDEGRTKVKRQNLVRSAVTAAKLEERKVNKRSKRVRRRPVVPNKNPDDFCLEDYNSDDGRGGRDSDSDDSSVDGGSGKNGRRRGGQARLLLDGAALDGSQACCSQKYAVADVEPGSGVRKIVYAARTHSQLSQFVSELKRTAWGDTVRVVALGGRKALCGNPALTGKSESIINETCLDLQKGTAATANNKELSAATGSNSSKKRSSSPNEKSSSGCPLLASRDAVDTLALHMLARPTDIEEAAKLGESVQTCAYYTSRAALQAAEVVVLPYSMLLSKQTRDAIGLSLKESLVLVDEAHNLPEALRALHSCRLSLPVAEAALEQLQAYTTRYANRLSGRNIHYLGQLRRMLLAFQRHLTAPEHKRKRGMMSPGELLIEQKLDNINLFRILRYLERSRLPQKLLGFTNYNADQRSDAEKGSALPVDGLSKHVSAMSVVQRFLEKLTLSGTEGKVTTDWPSVGDFDSRSRASQHPTLRYVLLHPAAFFENVLDEAHALALVGGTLRPFVHVAAELLGDHSTVLQEAARADANLVQSTSTKVSNSFVSPAFTAFTCDHVVSPSNVLFQCVAKGPTGQSLDFRHQSRSGDTVCDELGKSLLQICRTVPAGVVVFLPSYSYEAHLVRRWKMTGVWQEMQSAKKIYREPKRSQEVDSTLQKYGQDAKKGAVLFSVVGGKMSEGINFANDMARCVVVVGLPYPDITDPELKEKMTTMDASRNPSITGREYYQNLCMRAVNQSVGRAIRHANDYAAIVLVDRRYTTDSRIWSALPSWLTKGGGTQWRQDLPLDQRLEQMRVFFERKA